MLPHKNASIEIGVDEAGRGSLFGSVFAAAVIWNPSLSDIPYHLIKDSKKLTPKKRKQAYDWIIHNLAFGIASIDSKEIDQINILRATEKAMRNALDNLHSFQKEMVRDGYNIAHAISETTSVIIDGTGWESTGLKETWPNLESVVKGDDKYYSIAAASILAKVSHDMHIEQLCTEHPEWDGMYHLSRNMGYGTKTHIEGIRQYGYTEHHRMTFSIKSL